MEGGNKSSIDLESGLDISSSDMLVPISRPTFQHNWQKYQGKFLPNSLRFEKNGWAAGWNVYNFEYNSNRVKVSSDLWYDIVELNSYTKRVRFYSSEYSMDILRSFDVTPNNSVFSGGVSISGDNISGTVPLVQDNSTAAYTLKWDPATSTLSQAGGVHTMSVKRTENVDRTSTVRIEDDSTKYTFDFKINPGTSLVSESISDCKYVGYADNVHTWGGYTYDMTTGKVTVPEDDRLATPVVSGNTLTFSYSMEYTDESVLLSYTFTKVYRKFDDLKTTSATGTDYLLGSSASTLLDFNKYKVSLDKTTLSPGTAGRVQLDVKVPVWLSLKVKVIDSDADLKPCDNVSHNEIWVAGLGNGINNKIRYWNAYTGADGTLTLANSYNDASQKILAVPYYRFNMLQAMNTIDKAANWHFKAYDLRTTACWFGDSRRYDNLRNGTYSSWLGPCYSAGTLSFIPSAKFESYDPTDWSSASNVVYTVADLSTLVDIKVKGTAGAVVVGNDQDFITSHLSMTELFGSFSGTSTYSASQAAIAEADFGTATTYEVTAVSYVSGSFWPFDKVPRCNVELDDGTTITGVYAKSGSTYITDLATFKSLVLGAYSSGVDPLNSYVTADTAYNRTRVVTRYEIAYDFIDNEYARAMWAKWYPNYMYPTDYFNTLGITSDTRYMDFTDITVTDATMPLDYVSPGVYVSKLNNVSVLNPMLGHNNVVIYGAIDFYNNDAEWLPSAGGGGTIDTSTLQIYHNTVLANTEYNITGSYITTWLTFDYLIDGFREPISKTISMSIDDYLGDANKFVNVVSAYTGLRGVTQKYSSNNCKFIGSGGLSVTVTKATNAAVLNKVTVKYGGGKSSFSDFSFVSGIEKAGKQYTNYSDEDGLLMFGASFYGYMSSYITYPTIRTDDDINSVDNPSITFTQAPADNNKYYIDRLNATHSMYIADFDIKQISPYTGLDSSGNPTGSIIVTIKPVDEGVLYYAPRSVIIKNDKPQEITEDYYLPGILYASYDDTSGHMAVLDGENLPQFNITFTPDYFNRISSVNPSVQLIHTADTKHVLYTDKYGEFTNISVEVISENQDTAITTMALYFNGETLQFKYDGKNEVTEQVGTWNQQVMSSSTETVTFVSISGEKSTANIAMNITLYFRNVTGKFLTIEGNNVVLDNVSNNNVQVTQNAHTAVYSFNSNTVTSPKVSAVIKNNADSLVNVSATYTDYAIFQAALRGVYGTDAGLTASLSDNTVTVNYTGKGSFTIDLAAFTSDSDIAMVSSVDIRTPDKTKYIGKLESAKEYQLLKQQWNSTVEVENFWWIDTEHILELNHYNFVLKRNTHELHDWDGDRFEDIYRIPRGTLLSDKTPVYFVPSSYDTDVEPPFVVMQLVESHILVSLYKVRAGLEELSTFTIELNQVEIGQQLNNRLNTSDTAYLNTYSPLQIGYTFSKAEWSSTIREHYLILGCHISNNYDQWTIVYDLDNLSIVRVIQGYGFVGLHGDLTGGQIPSDYMNADLGFGGTVEDLSVLGDLSKDLDNLDAAVEIDSVDELNRIESRVVGTAEQQWYIGQMLVGVTSHLTYASDGKFTKQDIPLTNSYSAVYKSPSIATSVIGDIMLQATAFANMFVLSDAAKVIWNIAMVALGYPMMYFIAPRFGILSYLQQTLGQYAYVHYNSSKSMPEKDKGDGNTDSGIGEGPKKQTDPIMAGDFIFDKQKVTQTTNVGIKTYGDTALYGILFSAFSDSLENTVSSLSVNADQNQSAISDAGRKYSPQFVENVNNMLVSAIKTDSKSDAGLTSSVTALKSLDMFYSTCEDQQVFAGPGFVEHQFVADCVAQSVTDVQLEGKVMQLFFCIRALTTLQTRITIALENIAADGLDKAADATANQTVCGTSLGAVAVGMHAIAQGMRALINTQEQALAEIDKVLDAICADGISVSQNSCISNHTLSVEGKHKYGEKNEVFMWPCWGVNSGKLQYTDEVVKSGVKNTPWSLTLTTVKSFNNGLFNMVNVIMDSDIPKLSSNQFDGSSAVSNVGTLKPFKSGTQKNTDAAEGVQSLSGDCVRGYYMTGRMPFYQAAAYSEATLKELPDNMAKIEGVSRFLSDTPMKNENIGVSDPVFAPSLIHDYIIDENWSLSQCASYGLSQWVTCKDTKLTQGPASNIVVKKDFCGVASTYTAIEVRRGLSKAYMRPWAITPNTLAFNCTGYNTIFDDKLYHAFDGMSGRIVDMVGSTGLNKNFQTYVYAFQVNDRFKRSNIAPANEMLGNFTSDPIQCYDTIDRLWSIMTIASKGKGLEAGTLGEDKDAIRWSIPVFTEPVSTLPAAVKTLSTMPLAVIEGVTSLVTDLASGQTAYKTPLSVDFTIGKNVYRATEEYICSVQVQDGMDVTTEIVPSLGLKFIGSSQTEAFFYSQANRCYYSFTGSTLTKLDMMERFRDIQKGYWDFVNQEVIMPCLMTFKRLNVEVEDQDTETDNIIVPVLSKGTVSGELPPPLTTVFNDRSWYKCVSLPAGFAYQGPNRVIINRAVFVEYMERSIKDNFNKWAKMDREKYVTHRVYPELYDAVDKDITEGVDGWTYNPFVLVTSALGQSEDVDCIYEWVITFCWPIEMDLLYGVDNYACVNLVAETMTPGGKQITRPTHIFLTKELFTRNGNYGYYSFRYQSKNGAGNRERLHIWSDQYIAISSIDCEAKVVTSRRTEQLVQQLDVQKLTEL